jgi:N-acetyl-anhydromuramyl-L-alanine amidase AmpD
MKKRWVGCAPQNFRAGRPAGQQPQMIVLHSASGTVADATRAFFAPGSARSAHYIVGRDGSVTQCVQETDTAFHAGLVVNPAAALVQSRPGVNPNFYSIGIEHEGRPADGPWPDAQVRSSAALIAEAAARWRIPLDAEHVITHQAVRRSANCPGPGCDLPRLLAIAGTQPGEMLLDAPVSVTLTARANVRRFPATAADVLTVAQPGSSFQVAGVTRGQPVSGNDWWYFDGDSRYLWAGATDQPLPAQGVVDAVGCTDEMELRRPALRAEAATTAKPAFNRSLALTEADYVATVTAKDLIVLHFTAGEKAKGACETWRQDPRRIATAYIVDPDGTVFEMFDPKYWASHLGVSGGAAHDRRSIGIEIANVGPLTPSADNSALNWWVGQRYCSLDEASMYRKQTYRGFDYYAAYPPTQMSAVAGLVKHLVERFSIPPVLPPAAKRHEYDAAFFASFKGIATHANFRKDKFDVGPAFDWDALI